LRTIGERRARWGPEWGHRQSGTVLEHPLGWELLLGLERLERAQGAPEFGHGGTAIAQQCLERARAVAVADQGEPEPAAREPALLEQLGFNAIRPRQAPGGDRDAAREHTLERADRRQLRDQCRLEAGELGGVLVRQHEILLRAQAVLQRIRRAPCLRVCSARATWRRSCGWLRHAHC
jgi:hypothetical protein